MARMAAGRTTHLSQEEVARETLALFDEGDFSMRALGARLNVSPAAIYNHFENQSAVVQAAVSLVWEESIAEFLSQIADPVGQPGNPVEFLIVAAACARQAFSRHYRIATNLALPPAESDSRLSGALAIFGSLLESAGLEGEDASDAFYAYTTYTLGSILYRTHRRLASERLGINPRVASFSSTAARPDDAPPVSSTTLAGIDRTIASTDSDEQTEARLFKLGLRRLLEGFGLRGDAP
jgi:AcrR family transcriptional regulator